MVRECNIKYFHFCDKLEQQSAIIGRQSQQKIVNKIIIENLLSKHSFIDRYMNKKEITDRFWKFYISTKIHNIFELPINV